MKFSFAPCRVLCALFAVAFSVEAATASLSQIYVSIGPNALTSSSYAGYTANAQAGVSGGGVNVGGNILTTPTAYNVVGGGSTASVSTQNIIGTPFKSWLGSANPTGALSAETGNGLYWSIVISGTTGVNDIDLANVSVLQFSNDALSSFGNPGSPFTVSYAGSTYGADRVGLLANGTLVTSGASTQLVNKIVLTSFFATLDPATLAADLGLTFSGTDAQQMQQMKDAFAKNLGDFTITTCFAYSNVASTCDAVNVAVPEPSTFPLFSLSLLPFAWFLRRRRE